MASLSTPGQRLRAALHAASPLQMVGVVDAYSALQAQAAGLQALYLSGSGVAATRGLPDLGITTLDDVLTDLRRITAACTLPVLVDVDTGFGPTAFNLARTVRELERAGAAGLHIEDQIQAKRCGHRPRKAIVSTSDMVDRIKAVVAARQDAGFVIVARTDALAVEGEAQALDRAQACVAAGADWVFIEAVSDLDTYRRFASALGVPVLANITEFGRTPLFTLGELSQAGVGIALYPLSAFRAMSQAAAQVFATIRQDGTQQAALPLMQTRDELYAMLDYHRYEQELDRLYGQPDPGEHHD
jgi:methylisocitrate lyase